MRKTRRLAAVLLLLSAACGSAPKRTAPDVDITVPEAYGTEADGSSLGAEWWSAFGSETLDSLIVLALERNHDLKEAAARLDAAAAEARIAGAATLPTLDLSADAARSRRNFIGFPVSGGSGKVASSTSTTYGVSLGSSWELDLWGRVRSAKSAAAADYEAALADLAGARLSLAAQTAKAYFALVEARMQVDLARETVDSYRRSTAGVRDRFERGIRSSLDLRLSLAALAGSEALYELRREQHDRAMRQLEILLGRYPGGSAGFAGALPDPPAPPPAGLPADLVGRRPDVIAAERRLAASDARVRQAKAALFPSIRLTGSGGRSSQELGDLLDGDFTVWSIAAGVLQPIFRGGELRARVDLAGAGSRRALASYANTLLRAYGEVESALAAEGFLAAREEALTRASEQSAAARALAEQRYRSGLEDFVTLLEAQRRALAAESERIGIARLRLENRVDLCVALGGGFEENSR